MAGVVRIKEVKGGSNFRTNRGSSGVNVANYQIFSTDVMIDAGSHIS